MICENCGGRNIGACPSQIEGIDMKSLRKCYCCNAIFEATPNQFNEVKYLYKGDK